MKAVIETGDEVRIHYKTKSLEGCVVETSGRREPLSFEVGGNAVLPGIGRGVLGMRLGESRTLTLPPDDGFGRRRPELELAVCRDCLPDGIAVGDQLRVSSKEGEFSVWVQRIAKDEVLLDGNHPLAGETLIVEVQIVGHEPAR